MSLVDVAGVAQRLLDLVGDVAAAESIDLPERRYVTAGVSGAEAWDSEQVTVGLQQFQPGNAGRVGGQTGQATHVPSGAPRLAATALRVEIVRCVPTLNKHGDPPHADALQDAGVQAMKDAALLHAVRTKAVQDASLTDGEPGDILAGTITPSGPEGGLAGMSLVMTVTVLK